MKLKKCPHCGSNYLHDYWQRKRKLQQTCQDCGWKGEKRTPEIEKITGKKTISVGNFPKFRYETFDRFGRIMTSSRSYKTEEESITAFSRELEKGKTDIHGGPYTVIVWPQTVEVTGKIFK